jgi:hypothetical protein
VVIVIFYAIPHLLAKLRYHPHQDAVYAAGWGRATALWR